MSLLSKLLYLLDSKGKYRVALLLFISSIGAALEGVSLGLILPFIALINNPDVIDQNQALRWIYHTSGFMSYYQLLMWSGVALLLGYLAKNAYLAFMYYVQHRFVYSSEAALGQRLFRAYLYSPYTFHLQHNPTEMLRNIGTEVPLVFNQVMIPALNMISELMVVCVVTGVLLMTEPVAALVAAGALGSVTALFYRGIRRKIGELGDTQQRCRSVMFQWVSRGVGGIKETKVLRRESFFVDSFATVSSAYARAVTFFQTANQCPRLFIESTAVAGVLLIVIVMLAQGRKADGLLPILAVFAAATFRLIPSFSRVVNAVATIRYYKPAINVVYNDLSLLEARRREEETAGENGVEAKSSSLSFQQCIELKNVYYQYPGACDPSLRGVSLTIPKGRSVALVGPSGSGKTTVADIIIGLLRPAEGDVTVDGRSIYDMLPEWQRKLGYVPQSIYLSDDTIRRNVAFGVPDDRINDERVWSALKMAQFADFVESLPEKLNTRVGDRGARISGGQRQRLGIARALYHDPEVLVMDEATSALDGETETEVTRAIERFSGEKTIIVIAHRRSTVEKCDITFEIHEDSRTT